MINNDVASRKADMFSQSIVLPDPAIFVYFFLACKVTKAGF